ncbi:uncharacterized protein SPSK_08209 [Sporothrix schenckii 1099-18]|uniref:Uncharacterized protein n=1 Tax=Sporothrix schenckii 1099-18 TaxID=1397361 RepID=A0A0F2MFR6_SPOSC|nr:uncharacterized protein SPSK_08209 [Sporothrix schenckii 1099-18]KJR88457.1 hypothetical protein SPSK_08209 [Sporothrix schenckii 1099-18]
MGEQESANNTKNPGNVFACEAGDRDKGIDDGRRGTKGASVERVLVGLLTYVEARNDEKHKPSYVEVRLNYEVIRDTG